MMRVLWMRSRGEQEIGKNAEDKLAHIYFTRAFDVREEQACAKTATHIHHSTVISIVTDQLSEPIVYIPLNRDRLLHSLGDLEFSSFCKFFDNFFRPIPTSIGCTDTINVKTVSFITL